MGRESIFFFALLKHIGFGINWGKCNNEFYIFFYMPLCLFRILFVKKETDNKWFEFQNQLPLKY